MELSKTFDAKAAEERWFQLWIDRGYFKADPARAGETFSIVIPPPNVTGQLHLGHALNVCLQDIIVRTRRMQGYNTLWLPGTDHAGIATQNVVEREIASEGKTRHGLGREKFVERIWQWREQYGSRILVQLRRLGASCDWSRERFTLDPGLSRAVTKVFVDLYNRGLIYRGRRLINWCPRCETALSDLEVDHKERDGQLFYVRYPLVARAGDVTVATTRPETMLGDTAVAVHPDDYRYKALVGGKVMLPLMGREIPIIADPAVDREFGTGVVKITPGHDSNDFEIGKRHQLAQISVMDTAGRMNENAGPYRGLSREQCRTRVVEDLRAAGLLEKIEPHRHKVGVCSRCETAVEPMLSEQWFVRVKDLANLSMQAVRDGRTTFHPKFWENTFFNWMENVHDWCISRQLWWGQRIPAYRCDRCNKLIVAVERPGKCEECGGTDIIQDEDVLDTWFSSGLWPFSTLGWPQKTPDLARYYPTTLLITGFDIIFFWVARMMMLGLFCTGEVPFRDVYITPLVRDQEGKKMTKSRGNVVDPLDLVDQYGADALRLTLAQLAVQGRDVILSHERLTASRAFGNKVWNAARFVLMNLQDAPTPIPPVAPTDLSLAERWILSRLDNAIRDVSAAIDSYEFNVASMAVYQFIWHEFCDWFIELSKEPLKAGGERQAAARTVLVQSFDKLLRLLHPFMPFVSEELWQALRPYIGEQGLTEHLAVAKFPTPAEHSPMSQDEARAMHRCIEVADAINSLRALLGYHPGQRVAAFVRATAAGDGARAEAGFAREFNQWQQYAATMAKASPIDALAPGAAQPRGVVTSVLEWGEVSVSAPAGFDFARARDLVKKKLAEVQGHHAQQLRRLENPDFQAKAGPDIKDQVERRAGELESQRKQLAAQL
ncbi:MAG: valine--tRNA ligase, partial [Candidatus Binataceae bacterium]